MASAELSRRVGKVVGYPPLGAISTRALLDADDFEEGRLVLKLVTSDSLLDARALSRLCGGL